MAPARQAGGTVWLRPLLDEPREALAAYARRYQLDWIEDESNELVAFDRNYLRHEVMPALERRFPQYRDSLARLARRGDQPVGHRRIGLAQGRIAQGRIAQLLDGDLAAHRRRRGRIEP